MAITALVGFFVGIVRGWWVMGGEYRRVTTALEKAESENRESHTDWKDLALWGVTSTERATVAGERIVRTPVRRLRSGHRPGERDA